MIIITMIKRWSEDDGEDIDVPMTLRLFESIAPIVFPNELLHHHMKKAVIQPEGLSTYTV